MDETEYEEYLIAREKTAIGPDRMAEIDAWFDEAAAWLERLDAIRPTLERLERGGGYAAIRSDVDAGEVVFIRHDGTRFALAPERIATLFRLVGDAPPALRIVG